MIKKFPKLTDSLQAENKLQQNRYTLADQLFESQTKEVTTSETVARLGISLLKSEEQLVEQIQYNISSKGYLPTKSEIVRAGLLSLSKLTDAQIKELVNSLTVIKKGRNKAK